MNLEQNVIEYINQQVELEKQREAAFMANHPANSNLLHTILNKVEEVVTEVETVIVEDFKKVEEVFNVSEPVNESKDAEPVTSIEVSNTEPTSN